MKPVTSATFVTSSPVIQNERGLQPSTTFPTDFLENNVSPIKTNHVAQTMTNSTASQSAKEADFCKAIRRKEASLHHFDNMGDNKSENWNTSMPFEQQFIVSEHLRFVILAILIVFLNTFVLLLFMCSKNLRKPCNYLLASLSVSDLLTGLVGLPLLLVCSTVTLCLPCVYSYSFIVFTSISTVLHILVISYERYVIIVFPFKINQIGRKSFELKLVACLWFLSVLVPPIQYIWMPPTEESCDADWSGEVKRSERIFSVSIMFIFVGLPLILLIYADVSVFFVVRRQLNGIARTTVGSRVGQRDSQRRLKKETSVLILLAIMMFYFVISWSFYYAHVIYHSIVEDEFLIPDWLFNLVTFLRTTTPLVNPILYVLLKHDYRRVVCHGIRWFLGKYSARRQQQSLQSSNGAPTTLPSDSRNVTERTFFI